MARFQVNDGYTTYPASLIDRFIETGRVRVNSGPVGLRRQGYRQWQVGDHASLHLDAPLLWTLVEARITGVINPQRYRVVVTRFDGTLERLDGLAIGDECVVDDRCFFALWAPGETREDGEGAQKIYEEGSTRRPLPEWMTATRH